MSGWIFTNAHIVGNNLYSMKTIGKLYSTESNRTVILCTGNSVTNENRFEGVVVAQKDETSDHHVGVYSNTWNSKVFEECEEPISIDNANWKAPIMGVCQAAG